MTAVFEWDALREVADDDPEILRELEETFMASARDASAGLRTAMETLDREALGRAAHKFAGAVALGGGGLLARRVRLLEWAAPNEEPARLAERVDEIERLIVQVESERPPAQSNGASPVTD